MKVIYPDDMLGEPSRALKRIIESTDGPRLGGLYLFDAPEPGTNKKHLYVGADIDSVRSFIPRYCHGYNDVVEMEGDSSYETYTDDEITGMVEGLMPAGNWNSVFAGVEQKDDFLVYAEKAIADGSPASLGVLWG